LEFQRAYHQLPPSPVDAWVRPAAFASHIPADASRSERIEHVTAMPIDQKRLLAASAERFETFKPEQQQRIRDFHRTLTTDPDAAELTRDLDRYYEWYKNLPPAQRIELRFSPTADRMKLVERLRAEQEKKLERLRIADDMRAVVLWVEARAVQHRKELLAGVHAQRRKRMASLSESVRRRMLAQLLWQRWRSKGSLRDPSVSPQEVQALVATLSPETQALLDRSGDKDVLFRSITEQLAQQFQTKAKEKTERKPRTVSPDKAFQAFFRPIPAKGSHGPGYEQLRRIYRDKMTDAERAAFNRLPHDQKMATLRDRYRKQHARHRHPSPSRRQEGPSTDSDRKVRPGPPRRHGSPHGERHDVPQKGPREAPRDKPDDSGSRR